MPGMDRSGPMGAGAMTGDRRGLCTGQGYMEKTPGLGRGCGFGRGRGAGVARGRRVGPAFGWERPVYDARGPITKEDEIRMLKVDSQALLNSLQAIQDRIAELETEKTD